MPALSREWIYWALLNGIPAAFATVAFLAYAPFDKLFAWDVEHRQSGIFLGTGFLLRAALFVHIIRARGVRPGFGPRTWPVSGGLGGGGPPFWRGPAVGWMPKPACCSISFGLAQYSCRSWFFARSLSSPIRRHVPMPARLSFCLGS